MAAILDIRKGVYPHNEEFLQCLGIIRNTLRNDVWGTLRSSYFLRQPFNICLIRMKLRYWKLTWLCCRSFASKGVFWAIPVNSKSFKIAQKQPLRKIGRQYTAGIQGKVIQKFYLGFIVWGRSPGWPKATSFLGGSGGMPPRKCFEMKMRWDAIWCILRHNCVLRQGILTSRALTGSSRLDAFLAMTVPGVMIKKILGEEAEHFGGEEASTPQIP